MVGVICMMWGKTVLPPSPQASRSSALSATTELLSLSSSFNGLLIVMWIVHEKGIGITIIPYFQEIQFLKFDARFIQLVS